MRVPEDTSPWKDILQVSAQDADANSKLVFSIHKDSSRLFHLDPKSGVLVLKEELDYETSAVHTLVLTVLPLSKGVRLVVHRFFAHVFLAPPQVRDQEIPVKRNFARVVVYVEDCNDHAPAFLQRRYEANVSSQAPAGSELVRVRALDGDAGTNAHIRYSIVTGGRSDQSVTREKQRRATGLQHLSSWSC